MDTMTGAVSLAPTPSLRLRVDPTAANGRIVRKRLAAFVASHKIDQDDAIAIVTAIGEAVANAIEHADSVEPIEIDCRLEAPDRLITTVIDAGRGFEPEKAAAAQLPKQEDERGRGLPIMRHCSDIFAVRSRPGMGTAVVLVKYLRHPVTPITTPG